MSARRSIIVSTSLASLGASIVALAACNAKVLPLGTNTPSQDVSPSEVSAAPTACGANAAHPNVCCTGGPGQTPSCVTYPGAPFTPCASGTTTYPDPRSCCPLDGAGQCTATGVGGSSGGPSVSTGSGGGIAGSGSSGGAVGAGSASSSSSSSGGSVGVGSSGAIASGGGCSNACPPGWYAPPNVPPGVTECCTSVPYGTECGGGGSSSGSVGFGTSGASSCPACPSGWQVPEGEPNLCCTTQSDGVIQCFSQAGVPGGPVVVGGGGSVPPPVTSGACGGTGGADGGMGPCDCEEDVSGRTYTVSCDPAANECTCTVAGVPAETTFPENGMWCTDSAALFQACGFPTN